MPERDYKLYSSTVWEPEARKVLSLNLRIPSRTLQKVDAIKLRTAQDFEYIPNENGCYWIWTNEPIKHLLHIDELPLPIKDGEIIYNGVANPLRSRIKHHLLNNNVNAGMSGVGIDIFSLSGRRSHNKTAMYSGTDEKQKLPSLIRTTIRLRNKLRVTNKEKITDQSKLLELQLSSIERNFVINFNSNTIYFRNGINIFDDKHASFNFRVFYIAGINKIYIDYIEKEWRKKYGLPKLCSYKEGR